LAGYVPWLTAAGLALAVAAVISAWLALRERLAAAALALAFGGLVCAQSAGSGHGALAPLFRASHVPENPQPHQTGCPFLRGEHLRSHAAVLPAPDRDHGRQQGRAGAADRLGAAEIPAGHGGVRARLAGRSRGLRDVQRGRPRRLPPGPSRSDADRRARRAPHHREKTVSAASLALILTGVLLNA